jgi:putative mRNA 3-end processing factor
MNLKLKFLGGCREVGRSAILVDEILLDYGFKPTVPPEFPLPTSSNLIILSHAHLDHSGLLPPLARGNSLIYMTPPTIDLVNFLAKDTLKVSKKRGLPPPFSLRDLENLMEKSVIVDYEESFRVGEYEVMLLDASHIPGSSSIFLSGKKRVFYTGDINTISTRLLSPHSMKYPEADILIIESTYFESDHPSRFDLEIEFVDSILETLDQGGSVIIPCFAIGRTQEILLILENFNISPFLDGMGIDVISILRDHPSYLRDLKILERAFRNAVLIDSKTRKDVLSDPSVIVTTAGMLEGGPALHYIEKIKDDEKSKILLTGYQMEGTNGRRALEEGMIEINGKKIKLLPKVEQYDFSAHCGDKELKNIVDFFCSRGTQKVFIMHGEKCAKFADWIREKYGVDAVSPQNGEEFTF